MGREGWTLHGDGRAAMEADTMELGPVRALTKGAGAMKRTAIGVGALGTAAMGAEATPETCLIFLCSRSEI
jgi:hypothetical protein